MIVLIVGIERPDVLLVDLDDGYFAYLCNVDENRVKLSGVGILHFSFLFIVHVHLFFR